MRKFPYKTCLILVVMIVMSISFLTVFAYNDGPKNGLDVSDSGGKLVLKPGDFPSLEVDNDGVQAEAGKAFNIYKKIGTAILSIGTITMALFLVKQIYRLGKAGDNANNRQDAIRGILVTGIATALLGSLDIIVIVFTNALK